MVAVPDLLRSNRELRTDNIWNWTLPAWYVKLDNKVFKTCPNAGICAQFCYARNGTYLFSNVKSAHLRNLQLVLDTPELFKEQMIEEIGKKRFRAKGVPRHFTTDNPIVGDLWATTWIQSGGSAVRIHDSGDFFSEDYLRLWIDIATAHQDVLFYAYTKEVKMVKGIMNEFPPNFRVIFSKGGLQDDLIDDAVDRHADVFPDLESLLNAGYQDQEASDLLAVMLATNKVGIVANNIAHFKKKQGTKTFAELARHE